MALERIASLLTNAYTEHLAKVLEYLAPDTLDCVHTLALKELWTDQYEAALNTNVMQVPEQEESGEAPDEVLSLSCCLSCVPTCVC